MWVEVLGEDRVGIFSHDPKSHKVRQLQLSPEEDNIIVSHRRRRSLIFVTFKMMYSVKLIMSCIKQ